MGLFFYLENTVSKVTERVGKNLRNDLHKFIMVQNETLSADGGSMLQPSPEMIAACRKELVSLFADGAGIELYDVEEMLQQDGESVEDRIVFIWQAMVGALKQD